MDDPASDPVLLERTLRQFSLVNRVLSRMDTFMYRYVLRDVMDRQAMNADSGSDPTANAKTYGSTDAGVFTDPRARSGTRADALSGVSTTRNVHIHSPERPRPPADPRVHANTDTRAYPVTILDVGAGACDVPLRVARRAQLAGIDLRIICLDQDSRVVRYARRVVADHPAGAMVDVVEGSALELTERYDYIVNNHFLHHLSQSDIRRFLDTAWHATRRRLLVNDLLRSYWSLVGFRVFAGLFLHRSFARTDGEISIRKGFRPEELQSLARTSLWCANDAHAEDNTAQKEAGRETREAVNGDVAVATMFPGRVVLIASKPDQADSGNS